MMLYDFGMSAAPLGAAILTRPSTTSSVSWSLSNPPHAPALPASTGRSTAGWPGVIGGAGATAATGLGLDPSQAASASTSARRISISTRGCAQRSLAIGEIVDAPCAYGSDVRRRRA